MIALHGGKARSLCIDIFRGEGYSIKGLDGNEIDSNFIGDEIIAIPK